MELLKLVALAIGMVMWIALLMLAIASPFIVILWLTFHFFA